MQIGRWNHQSSDGHTARRSGATRSYSSRSQRGGLQSANRSFGRSNYATRGGNSYGRPQYNGARRGPKRGGFGSFGTTEFEISRFINKSVVVEEAEAVFTPEHSFSDFKVDERIKANVIKKGYETPTPIQDKAIPQVLLGHDVFGLAETGTGKTAAFLIPLIDKVMKGLDNKIQERVLVMAPTRELAVQIEKELAGFAKGLGFRGMVAVGGANIAPQISALRHNPAFVIGTPGRLKDLMERKALDLSGFGTVVLDEADRMLDMGFIDDMRLILSTMHTGKRHTLFFSATMGNEVKKLIGDFLNEPVIVSVKTRDTSKNIDQDVVRISRGEDKFETLVKLLSDRDFNRVLIFVRTKHGAERLAKMLSRVHIHADSIHGNKSYNARIRALEAFKRGQIIALVATDVAARGLDIPAVSHVINFDLPSTYEDYIHRIGRTGRASLKGKALTFV